MNKYVEWLEGQIKNANKLAERYAKEKEYSTAYMYLAKVTAFEECLSELEKLEEEPEQGVSFDDLEIGYRYGVVSKNGDRNGAIIVVGKGRDDYGEYIWYSDKADSNISFKSYSHEFKTARYFVEE